MPTYYCTDSNIDLRAEESRKVANHVRAFELAGGVIQQIPFGVSVLNYDDAELVKSLNRKPRKRNA